MASPPDTDTDLPILIVGAGFAGLGMAVRLQQAGVRDFTILERAPDIGGTWRDNRYPGCACDVPAHLYSFSFDPNPGWTRTYAGQREIWAYLRGVVDKHGLAPHIRCGEEVVRATYDERERRWRVRTAAGREHRARVLVWGGGALSNPAYPHLPGADRFAGPTFHSAAWDDAVELRSRRVAVIGTGASAIQFVPRIAPEAARVDIYQRTPPWIVPRADRDITALERWLFRSVPFTQRMVRSAIYWMLEARVLGFAVQPRLMKLVERAARRHLARQVADPALRALLTPAYAIGCKRVLLSNDYYPALARPNVRVIPGGARELRERAVVGADGREREADVVIYGTGFETQRPVAPGIIFGRGGVDLGEKWRGGPAAYKGTAVAGFPNLFFIVGPNTGLGHSSMVYMIESQVAYILDAFLKMRAGGWSAVEVSAEAEAAYNAELQRKLAGTVWQSGCRSWYLGAGGKNTALWPGFTFRFRRQTARFDAQSYLIEPAPGAGKA